MPHRNGASRSRHRGELFVEQTANIAVAMGIPAVAVGAAEHSLPHRLEEYADAESIVPGIKFLIALAVSLAGH